MGVSIVFQFQHALFYLAPFVTSWCLISGAHARCVLPVPDGGGATPSPANIEGHIMSIKNDVVVVQPKHSKSKISVRVPHNKPIYTAFGGDGDSGELRVGQKVWVWYVGCKRGNKPIPESAYFQIFSKDPNDRP